jgi:Domain of unknown function (DUF4157)
MRRVEEGSAGDEAPAPAEAGEADGDLRERALRRRMVQRKATRAATSTERVQGLADHGTRGAGMTLPQLDAVQRSFGKHDVSGVKAHTDAAASAASKAMGAEAFASGEDVAFAGAPSLHVVAHEAAHVVQQRKSGPGGGVGSPGDPHEKHADEVARRVVEGGSSEDLLDRSPAGSGGAAVQRFTVRGEEEEHEVEALTPDEVHQYFKLAQQGMIQFRNAAELKALAKRHGELGDGKEADGKEADGKEADGKEADGKEADDGDSGPRKRQRTQSPGRSQSQQSQQSESMTGLELLAGYESDEGTGPASGGDAKDGDGTARGDSATRKRKQPGGPSGAGSAAESKGKGGPVGEVAKVIATFTAYSDSDWDAARDALIRDLSALQRFLQPAEGEMWGDEADVLQELARGYQTILDNVRANPMLMKMFRTKGLSIQGVSLSASMAAPQRTFLDFLNEARTQCAQATAGETGEWIKIMSNLKT